MCARCHSDLNYMRRFNPQMRVDQFSEYQTSVHGMRNARGGRGQPGGVDVAQHGDVLAGNVIEVVLSLGRHADDRQVQLLVG